jgi:hypothetical protein
MIENVKSIVSELLGRPGERRRESVKATGSIVD